MTRPQIPSSLHRLIRGSDAGTLDVLDGNPRFEVQRPLGAGAMGEVYEAFDRERGESVALKTTSHLDPAALYRLKQEFRALADVAHPNLVSLHELFSVGERCFFTMELVQGDDLLTHLAGLRSDDEGRRDAAQKRARAALRQLSSGLRALHAAGKLHRDIKPSNVLVTPEQRVVLLDFGLSTDLPGAASSRAAATGGARGKSERDVAGTLEYMAPEQMAGGPLDAASDFYAVGAMLYEALTGGAPFSGPERDWIEVVNRRQSEEPPSARSLALSVPADLDEICSGLVQRDPRARMGGAELARLLDGARAVPTVAFLDGEDLLVGRERELLVLRDALADTRAGQPIAVRISGPSGLGKTALLRRFLDGVGGVGGVGSDAKLARPVVLEGRCYPRESVPYKALDSLIDALSLYLCELPEAEVEAVLPRRRAALARVFPVLDRVASIARGPRLSVEMQDPQYVRRRAFLALRELLGKLAARAPLVLCIDDLQWGDRDSAALLDEILLPPHAPPLLFIGSYRTDDGAREPPRPKFFADSAPASAATPVSTFSSPARASAAAGSPAEARPAPRAEAPMEVRRIEIGPLSSTDAVALSRALLSGMGPRAVAQVDAVARESAGSPYFIRELARLVALRGGAQSLGERVTLEQLLRARLADLPADARRLLETIAVSGRPLPEPLARRAAALPTTERLSLPTLLAARLIRSRGPEVEPFHHRIRELVVEQLSPEAARQRHLALATALADAAPDGQTSADAEAIAEHYAAAGHRRASGHYAARAAARAAAALAFDRAAKLYREALDRLDDSDDKHDLTDDKHALTDEKHALTDDKHALTDDKHTLTDDKHAPTDDNTARRDERRRLLICLGEALENAGRGADAARAFLDSVDGASPLEALELRRRAASQLLVSGHIDEGLATIRTVLDEVGLRMPRSPRWALLSVLHRRAQLRLRGLAFRRRAAEEVPPEELFRVDLCGSLSSGLSMIDNARGAYFQVRHLYLALEAGEPRRIAHALAMETAFVANRGGSVHPRAQKLLAATEAVAATLDDPFPKAMVAAVAGMTAYLNGHWQLAYQKLSDAESQLMNRCTGVTWQLDIARNYQVAALYHLGEIAELSRRVPQYLREAEERGDRFASFACRSSFSNLRWLADDDPEGGKRAADMALLGWSRASFQTEHLWDLVAQTQIELYRGDHHAAHRRVAAAWPALGSSLILRMQVARVACHQLRARTALCVAAGESSAREVSAREARALDRQDLLTAAERDAARIEREEMPWAQPLALLLRAAVSSLRGQVEPSRALLLAAEDGFQRADMALHAAVARRVRGALLGGEEGALLVAAADRFMSAQAIRNPARMTAMLAPGFPAANH